MTYPQRRSPRKSGYNYSQSGMYFITICIQNRLPLFGTVAADTMQLSPAGSMIAHWWEAVATRFVDLEIDLYVVMPNHFHGIVTLLNDDVTSLPQAIQWFKTMTTNHYLREIKTAGWESFEGQLWQRSFHDHIIRDEKSLNILRAYVLNNPARWAEDQFHAS